jgi:hypothetical protein
VRIAVKYDDGLVAGKNVLKLQPGIRDVLC